MIEKLKKHIDRKQVIQVLVVFAVMFIVMATFENVAYADGLLDQGSNNPFNGIKDGWGQFINDPYRNNYSLDLGDLSGFVDIPEKMINSLSNMLFSGMVIISWLGISIFNFCFNNNITNKFSEIIEGVSGSLKTGIFDKFFMLMFVISLISLLLYYLKRNYAAAINHILIVALLSIMAVIFSSKSANNFVMQTLNISNDIGMTLVSSLSGEEYTETAIMNMTGTLWGNLVHKPWVILEYDGKVSVDDRNKDEAIRKSKEMLRLSKNSDERKELSKEEIKDVSMTSRLSSTFILFLINLVKIGILMILGVIQIFLQILSNVMILIAPVLLLLAIVPFFGGLNMLKWLGQKYLGIQLNIILLSFAIGVLIVIDKAVLEFFIGIGASFTVALLIQCICWVLLIVFRKQIVLNFSKVQRRLNGTIAAGRLMNRMLDKEVEAGKWAAEKAGAVGEKATRPIRHQAVNMKDLAERKIKYASKSVVGNTKLAAAKTTADIIDKVAFTWDSIKNGKGENISSENSNTSAKANVKEKVNNPKSDIKGKLNDARKSNVVGVNFANEKKENTSIKDIDSNNELKDKIQDAKNREIETTKIDGIHDKNIVDNISENSKDEAIKDEAKKENSNNELKDKIQEAKDKEIEATNIEDIQDKNKLDNISESYKEDKIKDRKEKSNNSEEVKEKVQDKKNEDIEIVAVKDIDSGSKINGINNIASREIESSNIKDKEEPKIISFNQARVKMGKEEVDSDKLKENLRKDLQKEYRTEKRLKSEELQKAKQKSRAEILKSKLGVNSSQIKKQERSLNKELNKIKYKNTKNVNKKVLK